MRKQRQERGGLSLLPHRVHTSTHNDFLLHKHQLRSDFNPQTQTWEIWDTSQAWCDHKLIGQEHNMEDERRWQTRRSHRAPRYSGQDRSRQIVQNGTPDDLLHPGESLKSYGPEKLPSLILKHGDLLLSSVWRCVLGGLESASTAFRPWLTNDTNSHSIQSKTEDARLNRTTAEHD